MVVAPLARVVVVVGVVHVVVWVREGEVDAQLHTTVQENSDNWRPHVTAQSPKSVIIIVVIIITIIIISYHHYHHHDDQARAKFHCCELGKKNQV